MKGSLQQHTLYFEDVYIPTSTMIIDREDDETPLAVAVVPIIEEFK